MKLRFSLISLCSFLLLVLTLSGCFLQSRPRRAQRQLQKEQYAKTEKLLRKDLEKDSLNTAAYWLLSQLYLDTAYQQHIDTAHLFIRKAQQQAPLETSKDKKRWRKLGLDSTTMALQHARVDSAAFVRASRLHTVADYQYFLNNYSDAKQVAEATRLRNVLAFAAAEAINTWQAYLQFFQTYPQARQVAEARERYEELLFKERTRTGTLQAYRRFLAEQPQTPYRDRLLRNIYKLSTAEHSPQSYYQYIRKYPESPYSQQALLQLYYLHGEPATLWTKYPELPKPDSLQALLPLANQQLVAVLQNNKWGFISERGQEVLPFQYDDVHPKYLCESVDQDVAEVFANGQSQLIARNGQVVLQGDYEQIETLSNVLLQVQQEGRKGLLLSNGRWLLQPDYSNIRWLGNDLLLVKQERQSGIIAPNGQWLLPLQADSLARLQQFLLRIQGNRIAVTNRQSLIAAAQENTPSAAAYQYGQVRLLGDSLLLAIRPDSSWQVLNKNLTTLASGSRNLPQAIIGGLIVSQDAGYQVLNREGKQVLPGIHQQVQPRYNGISVKDNGRWSFWQLPGMQPVVSGYDSLQLLHPELLWLRNSGRDTLLFMHKRQRMPLSQNETVRLLRPQYVPDSLLSKREKYDKLVISSGKNIRIYNLQGKLLLQGRYEDVQSPDPALFILKTVSGSATLVDTSGQVLLKPNYDAIGNYNSGYLAILKNNKFGTISPYRNVVLSPQYDAAPRPYSKQLMTTYKNKRWSFTDAGGKQLSSHRYNQIRYWTDSVALVQEEDTWKLLHIYENKALASDIIELQWLRDPSHRLGGLAILETNAGYGIASTQRGILADAVYEDIQNLGTPTSPLFYLEKKNRENDTYDISYMNGNGLIIFRNSYSKAQWELLLCD